jgi:DNA repair exonuclease SbcCD ATPase subunit
MPDKKRKFAEIEKTNAVCTKLTSQLKDIITEKSSKDHDIERIKNMLLKCSVVLLELKEANREVHTEIEERKNALKKEKLKIDQQNSQLQNLLYEKTHFHKEIEKCKEFW